MKLLKKKALLFTMAAAVSVSGITAPSYRVKADNVASNIKNKIERDISVKNKKVTVGVGDTYKLQLKNANGKKIKWHTTNGAIAKFKSKSAAIKGVKKGTVKVYATVGSSKKKYYVTVKVVDRKINRKSIILNIKDSKPVQLKIGNLKQSKIMWSVDNDNVVNLTKAGKVSVRKKGTAVVTGLVKGGTKKYKCKIKVTDKLNLHNENSQNLITEMYNHDKKNVVYSPQSLDYVLAMFANGADDSVNSPKKMIKNYFGYDIDKINKDMLKLMEKSEKDKGLEICNSVWYKKGIAPFDKNYKKKITKYFNAPFYADSYEPTELSDNVNGWVSDKTHGLIKKLLRPEDVNEDSRVLLLNAIYFNKKWKWPFSASGTYEEKFTDFQGKSKKEEMMHDSNKHNEKEGNDYLEYHETDNATGFSKKYKGNYTFYAILPKKKGLSAFKNIDVDDFINNADKSRYELHVTMPKFEIESNYDLLDLLDRCGVGNFDRKILNNMLDKKSSKYEKLEISKILQKSVIKVDEEGTKAAAVTGGFAEATSCINVEDPWPQKIVRLTRPFEYVIVDNNTNSILFMGIYAGDK